MVEQPPYPGSEPQPGYPGQSGYPTGYPGQSGYPPGYPPPPGHPPYPGYPPAPGHQPYPGHPPEAGPPGGPAWAGGPWPAHSYPPTSGGYWPGYPDPNDPLVTPPGAGIDGWFSRIVETVRRSWRVLLPIMAITQGVPALAILVLTLALGAPPAVEPADSSDPASLVATLRYLAVLVGVVIGATVLLGLLQALGWAAGTWAVTRRAISAPASVSDALRYGMRRALGLWGWSLLAALIIVAGVCACVLPGVYLVLPLSLVGPVFLFERTNPIGRSFRIFHQRLGMMLGRVLLVVAVVLGASAVIAVAQEGLSAAFGLGTGLSPAAVLIGIVATVVTLPVYIEQLVGLVVTYAEQRGYEAPVNSAQLAAELDRS